MEEEMEICSNCKREIRSVNYVTHSVHCHRNIVICNKCNEPVPRAELEEHDVSEHGLKSCKECGAEVEKALLQKHEKESCPKRKVICSFCELDLMAVEAADHESYCGTRTEKCSECGEFVMLKYQTLHLDSNHGFLKLEDEPGPPPSWEAPPKTKFSTPAFQRKPSTALSRFAEPSRPILKSSTRPPAVSSLVTSSVKKAVPNSVRFAPVETPAPSPKVEKEEPQIKFANNKIGAEVKPIVNDVQPLRRDSKAPLSNEEADRLFAFKLAQDEMEMMSKYQLDGIMQHRRKIADSDKSMKDPELVEKPAPIRSLLTQRSVDYKREKSPTPKRAESPTFEDATDREEEVQIPCEFCEVLIPFSRLLIHQTGCRPDLACYIPFRPRKPSQANPQHDSENDKAATGSKTQTKNIIPCDLCNISIPADKFIQHQLACEIKHLPGRSEKPKALVMPLSGRHLRASKSIDESILPALENLEREADKNYKATALRTSSSAGSLKVMSGPSKENKFEEQDDSEKKMKQGAVPKQKARCDMYRLNSSNQP